MTLRRFIKRDTPPPTTSSPAGKATEEPLQAACQEARLEIRTDGDLTTFTCTAPRMRFFRVEARLAGVLSVSRSVSEDRVPTVRVTVPMRSAERDFDISALFCTEDPYGDWPLRAANIAARSDGQAIDFFFGDDRDRILYTFELPMDVDVKGFDPVERPEAPASLPSVAQVGAMLRASFNDRREVMAIIEDLSGPLSPRTLAMVGTLRDYLPPRFNFQTLPLQWLQEVTGDRQAEYGPAVQAALALLLDMEAGHTKPEDVEQIVAGSQRFGTSWEALCQVARLYGETLDPEKWRPRFEEARLSFPSEPDVAVEEKMGRALLPMLSRLKRRQPVEVLANLVRESPGPRVEPAMQAWKGRGSVRNPEHLDGLPGFRHLLSLLGRKIDPSTLMALCLYAELEAGMVSLKDFEDWLQGGRHVGLSPGGMEAVALALDLDLMACVLPQETLGVEPLLRAFLRLSPAGMLQGLKGVVGDFRTWRFLGADSDVEMPRGCKPSGDLILATDTIERLSPEELRLIVGMGNSVYASFQSDLDRRRQWRKVGTQMLEAHPDLTFVESFRVYHFQNRIVGSLVPADQAPATIHGAPPDVYRDHRGNTHYARPDAPPSLESGLERSDLVLVLPDIGVLPEELPEQMEERVLGEVGVRRTDPEKLELLAQSVPYVLSQRLDRGPALTGRGLQSLHKHLETPALVQSLQPVVDPRTLDEIKKSYLNADNPILEYRIYEAVLRGLKHNEVLDFVCLALVYQLCETEVTSRRGFVKSFHKALFRATLRNQLLSVLASENPAVRQLGCRLLGTPICVGGEQERPVVMYELLKHLDTDDRVVAQEACTSLTRLAFEKILPLPPLWECTTPGRVQVATRSSEQVQREFLTVTQQVRDWELLLHAMLRGRPATRETGVPVNVTGGMREISWLIASAREAFRLEQREGRMPRNFVLMLLSDDGLTSLMQRFFESWAGYGKANGRSASDLAQEVSGEQMLGGYLDFLRSQRVFRELFWPIDQAVGSSVVPWSWGEVSKPELFWILDEREGLAINPFFMYLMQRSIEKGIQHLRLCRLRRPYEGRQKSLPVPFRLEVFNARTGVFVPYLEEMGAWAKTHLEAGAQELLDAVVTICPALSRVDPFEPEADGTGPRPGEPGEDGDDQRVLFAVARQLLDMMHMSETYLSQVLGILKDARANFLKGVR